MQKTQTQRIIDRFGSREAFAEAADLADTTVRNWLRAGRIPQKYHFDILVAARERGVELSPADFSAHLVDALIEHQAATATSGASPAAAG